MSSERWMDRSHGSPRRNADREISNLKFQISNFPMTLGRTSDNKIKIKTDEEGGGLRAVECACCGGECGCYSAPVSVELLQILRGIDSAASITCNGVPPDDFEVIPGGFSAFWSDYETHGVPSTGMQFVGGCLTIESFLFNALSLGATQIIGTDGSPISCCILQGGVPCIEGEPDDIVINGKSFPSFREIFLDGFPIVKLNIVFS